MKLGFAVLCIMNYSEIIHTTEWKIRDASQLLLHHRVRFKMTGPRMIKSFLPLTHHPQVCFG